MIRDVMVYNVGVFEYEGKRKTRLQAYVRDYNPKWAGCCVHRVQASNGKAAKTKAIREHLERCMVIPPTGAAKE